MVRRRGRISGWFESLLYQGVSSGIAESLEKRIRMTNAGAVFAVVALLASVPIDVIQAPHWIVVTDLLGALGFGGIVLLNRRRHHIAARIGFLALANLLVLANTLGLGVESGVDMFYVALAGFPFVLFDLRDWAALGFGLALPVAGFVLSHSALTAPLAAAPDDYSQQVYRLYSAAWAFAAVVFCFYQVSRANLRAEQALRDDIAARERTERELAVSRQASITAAKLAALGEMSANVAHEVNNPLAAILLRARRLEMLASRQQLDTAAVLRSAQQIGSTVDRIRRIVDALRFSARQGDGDPFRPEPVRMIVDDTVELCAQRFRMANVDLTVSHGDEEAYIECRGPQISQVLLNLLSNAFDAVHGQPVRRVQVSVEANEQQVRIAVTDSGGGIPPELAHRIMEPFFTTKDIGHGTGLGLSLSKGIAEAHGGQLQLDGSAPGETRFVLTLRRCAPPELPSTVAETAEHSPG